MSPDRLGGLLVASPVPPAAPPAPEPPTGPAPDPMRGAVRGDRPGLLAYLTYALAGRLPDVDAAIIRTRVADGDIEEAIDVMLTALDESDVELTPAEARVAMACLAGASPESVPRLRVVDEPVRPVFHFSPAPDGPAPLLLEAAASVAASVAGIAGLWLTLRTSETITAAPVWLCEAWPGSDLIEITGEIQHRLAVLGEVPPRVEAFTPEAPLTAYHRDALAGAVLVWVAPELPSLHVARTFDGADPRTGPYFAPDHPRLAEPDRARLLAYLRAADVVLTAGAMPDVLDPSSPPIPMTFRCDAVWVFTEPVVYYLERYGLIPDPALTEHVLRASAPPRPCSPLTRARALTAIAAPDDRTEAGA